MKQFSYQDIESWKPCYSPSKFLPETWSGTVLDILDDKRIPVEDRLWVIARSDLVSEKLMRVFAVWSARQVQHLMKDDRSLHALDVMDAYCENYWLIDDVDWQSAWNLERSAASDAAWDAARNAASDAARAAARAAAWNAASDAARAAARAAAWCAASDAARAAARAAAWDAARNAASDAAWAAQAQKLRELLIAGVLTGDTK